MAVRLRLSAGRLRSLLVGGAVVIFCAALLVPSFDAAVSEMDEGALLAYGQLVTDGAVPGRDFETFYGPGEPGLLAASFEIATPSVAVERAVGLASRLTLLVAIFVIALRWGRLPAVAATGISLLAMYPIGVSAFALWAALALGLGGLALLVCSSGESPPASAGQPPGATALAAAGGISSGLAILFYNAVAPAVVLASFPLTLRPGRSVRLAYVLGFLVGMIPTAAWLAVLGPDGVFRLAEDLAASRPGRQLPLPGLSTAAGQVLLATVLATAGMLGTGVVMWRSPTRAHRGAILISLGLFCLALLPQVLQRADTSHAVSVGCVALVGVPLLLAEAISPGPSVTPIRRRWLLGAGSVLAVLTAGAVTHTAGPLIRDEVLRSGRTTYDVRIDGRTVPILSERAAADLNAILPRLSEISEPGDSLFVGPRDLRRTNYSDTFVYFLMPELRPASFYTEINPGATNSPDSGLAGELRTADYLLLTSRWDQWNEPNASSDYGSDAPSQVVDRLFSPVARRGSYVLYAHDGLGTGSGADHSASTRWGGDGAAGS
jgi:hypothetical protein